MEILKNIAEDTGRSYAERDLARILWIATELLKKGDLISAKGILKIHLENTED
jgi:hypothetical protein